MQLIDAMYTYVPHVKISSKHIVSICTCDVTQSTGGIGLHVLDQTNLLDKHK